MKIEYKAVVGKILPPIPEDKEQEFAKLEGLRCLVTIEELSYKTYSQNRAFHALVGCFWRSGCSSFNSQHELRSHYIIETGHIAYTAYIYFNEIDGETRAFSVGSVDEVPDGKDIAEICYPGSWSNITKERAMQAMNSIMRDMDESGVMGSSEGKKYAEILDGMMKEDWFTKAFKEQ